MKDLIMALALCVGIAAFSAFDKPTSTKYEQITAIDENGEVSTSFAPVTTALMKGFTKDTITNTGTETLVFPGVLASPYQYCYQIRLTGISGTRSLKVYLEQVSLANSTRWMKVDSSIIGTTLGNDFMMKGTNSYGIKQRVTVTGVGTQVTAFQVDAILKKTN